MFVDDFRDDIIKILDNNEYIPQEINKEFNKKDRDRAVEEEKIKTLKAVFGIFILKRTLLH